MNAGLPAGGTRTEPGEFHFPGRMSRQSWMST